MKYRYYQPVNVPGWYNVIENDGIPDLGEDFVLLFHFFHTFSTCTNLGHMKMVIVKHEQGSQDEIYYSD